MKKLFLLLILVCCFYSSCRDHGTLTIFYVNNISNHDVEISVFNAEIQSRGGAIDTTYVIPKNGRIEDRVSTKGDNDFSYFPFGNPDSAIIVFDNSLRIIYRRNDSNPRNILKIDSYSGGKVDDGLYEFYYSITEEDYNKAEK
ncbi:MAG: hypothetical protein HOO91_18315 [Bacteroidales bacterium]|nr:hypothetical protein [Bacteroidales bacterium]